MSGRKAKLLRKALGGHKAIISSEVHRIGFWPSSPTRGNVTSEGESAIHFVDSKPYHLYKNLKKHYKTHHSFHVAV
jgi:hypothetical protein